MDETKINDTRTQRDFGNVTFSKYAKSKVKKELMSCMANSRLEAAANWTAELVCAGHFIDLWEIVIAFLSRHIHVGNPKLPIYIANRMDCFKDVVSSGYVGRELELRNSKTIRELFAEVITTLCTSRRKHVFEPVKINRDEAFDMSAIASKLTAPDVNQARGAFRKADPKELFIAVNEFAYNLSRPVRNSISCCYWVEWILEYEVICRKKKEKCLCERRVWAPVAEKEQMDVVWILWDVLRSECDRRRDGVLRRIMDSLLGIFSIRYASGVKRRRRFLLYFAVSLLTEHVDTGIEIMGRRDDVMAVVRRINLIYKDIKANEEAPSTDYLFHGQREETSAEKTARRLELMRRATGI